MKSLEELGVCEDDWKVVRAVRKESHVSLYSHPSNDLQYRGLNSNSDDLPVSPSEEETIQLLQACARRLGFEYVPG